MKENKKNDSDEEEKHLIMPSFSYLIEIIQIFSVNGVRYVLAAFENKSVQIFDFLTGLSIYEFDFGSDTSEF